VRRLLFSAALVLAAASAHAADAPKTNSKAAPAGITAGVASLAPQAAGQIAVSDTPIAGIKEVRTDGQIVYMTEDGAWLFAGDIIDVRSKTNITDVARGELRAKALASSDPSEHIVYGPADNPRKIYVFTDTSCPYCTKFHGEVPKIVAAGITVEYLAWPRGGPRGPGYGTMQGVWCSKDRAASLDKAFAGEKIPVDSCEHPLKKHYELGASMDVQGTPSIYDAKGTHLGGFITADRVIAAFKTTAETPAKSVAATP